jgi:PAS domain S-box-containing protein
MLGLTANPVAAQTERPDAAGAGNAAAQDQGDAAAPCPGESEAALLFARLAELGLWAAGGVAAASAVFAAWLWALRRGVRQATAAARAEHEFMRRIIDVVPHMIYVRDENGRFVIANRATAEAFGIAADAISGQSLEALGTPEPRLTLVREQDRRVLESDAPLFVAQEDFEDAAGRRLLLQTSKVPIRLPDRDAAAILGVSIDMTERQKAETEVRRLNAELEERVAKRTDEIDAANRELAAFTYSVSHDLRAPLRTIDGFSRILMSSYAGQLDEQGRHFIDRIRAGTQTMSRLIDDLLRLSRATRGVLHPETLDLSHIVRSTAAEFQNKMPERQVTLKIEEEVTARGDARYLQLALENLLSNAFKYTSRSERPEIMFGNFEQDGKQIFFIRDNGAGFDMAYADKLFRPFQRLHNASEFEGSGIGLATVNNIIRRHRGRIWAEGAIDRGATFYFTLGDIGEQ